MPNDLLSHLFNFMSYLPKYHPYIIMYYALLIRIDVQKSID